MFDTEGIKLGLADGIEVGIPEGGVLGVIDGIEVGCFDGERLSDGLLEGWKEGPDDG